MGEMRKLDPGNDEYQAKFQVLMENVEHHIEEEEGEMFPMASERLGDTLDSLGTKMEERKQELQTSGPAARR